MNKKLNFVCCLWPRAEKMSGEITRECVLSSKKENFQLFVQNGVEREINWSVEIKGFAVAGYENLGSVRGTERMIPAQGVWGYALPHETPYGLRIASDYECNAEIFIDGMDASHSQGLFRIMPGVSSWIMRPQSQAKAFTLLGVGTKEGEEAGVKDDEHAGRVIVKLWPIVFEDTEEYRRLKAEDQVEDQVVPVRSMDDGEVKYRKRSRTRGGYSAAGTGLGDSVAQRFHRAEQKRVVKSCDHLQMSCVLMCKEKVAKYSPVYQPEVSSRAAFGL
jgi:hypothetical protein